VGGGGGGGGIWFRVQGLGYGSMIGGLGTLGWAWGSFMHRCVCARVWSQWQKMPTYDGKRSLRIYV